MLYGDRADDRHHPSPMVSTASDELPGLALRRVEPHATVMADARGSRATRTRARTCFVIEVLGGLRGGFFLDSGASDGVQREQLTAPRDPTFGWRGNLRRAERRAVRSTRSRSAVRVRATAVSIDQDGERRVLRGGRGLRRNRRRVRSRPSAVRAVGVVGERNPDGDGDGIGCHASGHAPSAPCCGTTGRRRSSTTGASTPRAPSSRSWSRSRSTSTPSGYSRSSTTSRARARQIRQFLEARGYRRVRLLGIDDAYVRDGVPGDRPWRSRAWSRRLNLRTNG